MARDAEETRRRLLAAAVEEFAAHGIAGARVERISTSAGVNNALLYRYFGNKLDLFDAAFAVLARDTVDAVPIDGENLAEYAGALFDYHRAHPAVVRLSSWYQLERADRPLPAVFGQSQSEKVRQIELAQKAGRTTTAFTAVELLTLVIHLSLTGMGTAPEFEPDVVHQGRRAAVVKAVRAILAT